MRMTSPPVTEVAMSHLIPTFTQEEPMLNSSHAGNDVGLHFSALSFQSLSDQIIW